MACGLHAVLFNALCSPTQFSNYTYCAIPNALNCNKFPMHAKYLFVFHYFIFKLNKVKMCFNKIHICVRLW
jgi:hypothetical protein